MTFATQLARRATLLAWTLALTATLLAADPSATRNQSGQYRLGPADMIGIDVFGVSDLSVALEISNSGKIHFPRLGVISIIGQTTNELARYLETALVDKGLVANPSVRVRVLEYRSQPVYIMGEVTMPGQYVITDSMYLTDLIGVANGLVESAGQVGYLYRRAPRESPDGQTQTPLPEDGTTDTLLDDVQVIRLDTLFSDPSANIRLQGGDMFYVPVKELQYFYVIGDVLQPGRREIQAGDSVLSVRALAMAGGPLKTAKLSEAVLVTRRPDGSVIHDEVNLKNILVGKKQDFAMQPGQILFVPGSMSKSLGYGILNAAPMLVLF